MKRHEIHRVLSDSLYYAKRLACVRGQLSDRRGGRDAEDFGTWIMGLRTRKFGTVAIMRYSPRLIFFPQFPSPYVCPHCMVRSLNGWLEIVGHLFDLLGRDADGPIERDASAG